MCSNAALGDAMFLVSRLTETERERKDKKDNKREINRDVNKHNTFVLIVVASNTGGVGGRGGSL